MLPDRLNHLWIKGNRHDHRVLAFALKRVGMGGPHEQECALFVIGVTLGAIFTDATVLHPDQFGKIMGVQRRGALARQHGT